MAAFEPAILRPVLGFSAGGHLVAAIRTAFPVKAERLFFILTGRYAG
jgi:hypothetical protein